MNRSLIFALLIPLGIVFAGWLGFHLYQSDNDIADRQYSDTQVSVRSVETPEIIGEDLPEAAHNVENDADQGSKANQEAKSLRYINWNLVDEADQPKACFTFNSEFDPDNQVALRDYVEIKPETAFSLTASDTRLCLVGFSYDETYEVRFKKGMRGSDNHILKNDRVAEISFGDKPAYVGFAGEGIILPRVKAQGLAIETVNVREVQIEVARVPDRMMARRDPQSGEATLEGDYGWEYQNAAVNIRDVIWEGQVDIKSQKNQTFTTIFDIQDVIKDLKPGAYIVTVERQHEKDERQIARAWRWIIVTDMALTSYQGDHGLTVSVRSIDSAKLLPGTELLLVAQNNDVLAKTQTDSRGYADFAAPLLNGEGPKSPKMIMAYAKNGDYAVLDLARTPLDLSEYDVAGRRISGETDIYGFSERGVYRPGELAHFTIMMRDLKGIADFSRDVTLTVKKPNGVEMFKTRRSQSELKKNGGVLTWSYDVPGSAPRGVWTLEVTPDGSDKSQRVEFSVEDFVPQKLKLDIKTGDQPIYSGDVRQITLDAQFLYGAPGAALETEAEARIRIDPNPFSGYEAYSFGPDLRNFTEQLIDLGGGITDGNGQLVLAFDSQDDDYNSPYPLRLEVTAGVSEPGGRYIRDSIRIPLRTSQTYLGIDPQFENDRVKRRQPANFEIVALDRSGERIETGAKWTLIEEDWNYHWYRERGRWRYRRDVRDRIIDTGSFNVGVDKTASWSQRLNWGAYRLRVETEDGAQSEHAFSVGWGRSEQSDAPDQLQLGVSAETAQAGDLVNLTVNAPYAGQAELIIANQDIQMVKPLSLKAGTSELSFKFEKSWGRGVYAMMTLYTPRDIADRPIPRRAVGLSYIALDRSNQTLNIEIDSPDILRPGTEQTFVIDVDSPKSNEPVWINFAAVDEGILQLTKYASPDAPEYFYGKTAFNIDIRDDYGRILNANLGSPSAVKTGGDSLGGEGLTVVPTKTVALFEGLVRVKNGKAKITLPMPDFNGELRLMATAWSETAVGSTSKSVKLRDKIPAIVGLPRFLAPGDQAYATLSLDNVEGQAGTYVASLRAEDVLNADASLSFELDQGQRLDDKIEITAKNLGVGDIQLAVSGPNYSRENSHPFEVRSPFIPINKVTREIIQPGQSLILSSDLVDGFIPNSTDITVSFSRLPGVDATPYVKSLARYPYGCTEQTVSSAMPLLYASQLGGIPGQTEQERRRGINKAISRLSSRQTLDGAFGLWRSGDRYAYPWLGVYVTDFLYRAKDEGFVVPDDVLERASTALKDISRNPRYLNRKYRSWQSSDHRWSERQRIEAAAYAHFVLAKTGQGNLGQMRYFFDNHSAAIKSPMAQAQITAGLAMMGDQRRITQGLEQTIAKLGFDNDRDYYQTGLRDISGAMAAFSVAENSEAMIELSDVFLEQLEDAENLHTNEKAHVILALKALKSSSDTLNFKAENPQILTSMKDSVVYLYGNNLKYKPEFKSLDDKPIWASISVSGSPESAPEPVANGLILTKSFYRPDGSTIDVSSVSQGDRIVVKLAFNSNINRSRTIVLADLLPGGFEIETVLKPDDGDAPDGSQGAFAWLGEVAEFQVAEAQDDRFIGSLETYRKDKYVAAYIVRAVTPGSFTMPGAVLEDMYRPQDIAITKSGQVTISPDPAL